MVTPFGVRYTCMQDRFCLVAFFLIASIAPSAFADSGLEAELTEQLRVEIKRQFATPQHLAASTPRPMGPSYRPKTGYRPCRSRYFYEE